MAYSKDVRAQLKALGATINVFTPNVTGAHELDDLDDDAVTEKTVPARDELFGPGSRYGDLPPKES